MGGVFSKPKIPTPAPEPEPVPQEIKPPVVEDTAGVTEKELKKTKKQRGRASTIIRGAAGDDSAQATGGLVKTTLGA